MWLNPQCTSCVVSCPSLVCLLHGKKQLYPAHVTPLQAICPLMLAASTPVLCSFCNVRLTLLVIGGRPCVVKFTILRHRKEMGATHVVVYHTCNYIKSSMHCQWKRSHILCFPRHGSVIAALVGKLAHKCFLSKQVAIHMNIYSFSQQQILLFAVNIQRTYHARQKL